MTSTDKKALAAAVERGTIVLKQGGDLAQIREALTDVAEVEAPQVVAFPPVPSPIVLTDDVKKALRRLPDVFAQVQPLERRALTEAELAQVHDERDVLGHIVDLLGGRQEDLKEIVRTHMDVVAEKDGKADPDESLRDAHGHYVLAAKGNPERVHIPGTNLDFSREYRAGRDSLDTSVLEEMVTNGEISREAYLAMTVERRVFDENKTMLALSAKDSLRADIFKAIKAMTKKGVPGTSLFTRKAK